MKKQSIQLKHYNFSKVTSLVEFNTEDNNHSSAEKIYQLPQELSIHNPDKKWLLLSSEVGYFNRVTQFITGDVLSILFLNVNGELQTPTITEVSENPQKYFMLYPLPFNTFKETHNEKIIINKESKLFGKINKSSEEVELNFKQGLLVGKKFFNCSKSLTDFEEAINGSTTNEYFWPHKNLIINSNVQFVLGVLFGYLERTLLVFQNDENKEKPIKEKLFINKTNNSYIFSTILNWLGASYSFQNIDLFENDGYFTSMRMHLSLPHSLIQSFKEILKDNEFSYYSIFLRLFKSHEWYLTSNNKVRKMPIGAKEKSNSKYNELVDSGEIRIIPMTTFKFIDVSEKEKNLEMYDLTMPRADATNYAMAFTPFLKNSDGDILTLSAVSGKESIEDAKAFEPSHKAWFRNLNNGEITNYIADDAVLGLFAATKHLQKT